MKASAFSYARADSVADAVRLLAVHGDGARLLAGGQSLMSAMNLRLLAPDWLIDIGAIPDLRGITMTGATIRIGAGTRHAEIAGSPEIATHLPLLAQAIAQVAHPAIRNRGTLGGNLAHADPASELPACMLALDAVIIAAGPDGERRIAADAFFTGIYQTALRASELLVAVEIPVPASGAVCFFHEFARRQGDYAIVGLSAQALLTDGALGDLRLAYFAAGDRPTLAVKAARELTGALTPERLAAAQAALADDLSPHDDQQATAAMRLHLARVLLGRGVAALGGASR